MAVVTFFFFFVAVCGHVSGTGRWEKDYDLWRRKEMVKLVMAEMKRSIAKARSESSSSLLSMLQESPGSFVLVYENRVIVDSRFLAKEKNRKHGLFLASLIERGFHLRNSIYAFSSNSTGACDAGPPCLVIAKRDGYEAPGILSPNPYFHDFDFWSSVRSAIRKVAEARPLHERTRRVFWRGHIANSFNAQDVDQSCRDETGNFARLQAAALSTRRPDLVDAYCWQLGKCLDIRNDATQVCPGLPSYDATMRRIQSDPRLVTREGHVPKENFTLHQFVLNLPGSTQGSYSRNANHLWLLGSVVLWWQATFKEWYSPALRDGVTHRDVNYTTLVPIVESLTGRPNDLETLLRGASLIDDTFLCPECLAFYFQALLDRLAVGFPRTAGVLDDPLAAEKAFGALDCSHLTLVHFVPSTRHLSHFDLGNAHTRRRPPPPFARPLPPQTQQQRPQRQRRLSTVAAADPFGQPGSCDALVNLARAKQLRHERR